MKTKADKMTEVFLELEKLGSLNNEWGKRLVEEAKDTRYNEPKGRPQVSEELITETVESTEIYRRAKEHILKAQRGQVGYGLDKYPEPLNANTWSMIESIDHIIDESVDKLHYLVMLRIQLERLAEAEALGILPEEPPLKVAEKCIVKIQKEWVSGIFIDLGYVSEVVPPSIMMGGGNGGVEHYPVAIVRVGNELKEVRLNNLKFGEEV